MSPRPFPTPALDAWRDEMRRGQRTMRTYDALWQAACSEASALELEGDGLSKTAGRYRSKARKIICAAARAAT